MSLRGVSPSKQSLPYIIKLLSPPLEEPRSPACNELQIWTGRYSLAMTDNNIEKIKKASLFRTLLCSYFRKPCKQEKMARFLECVYICAIASYQNINGRIQANGKRFFYGKWFFGIFPHKWGNLNSYPGIVIQSGSNKRTSFSGHTYTNLTKNLRIFLDQCFCWNIFL